MRKFLKSNALWLIMFPAGVIADQVTKWLAKTYLGGRVINVIDGWFSFWLTYNTGGAWSIFSGKTWILAIFSAVCCVAIAYYYFKGNHKSNWTKVALCMIFTGAFGNMIDRIFLGKVVDFIDFNFFKLFGGYFPIFNIADIFVTSGAVVLLVAFIFFEKDTKKGEKDA